MSRILRVWRAVLWLFVAGCATALVVPHDSTLPLTWRPGLLHPVADEVLSAIGILVAGATATTSLGTAWLLSLGFRRVRR